MNIVGVGKRVRVYIGESDQWHGRPLFIALLETLRGEGCAGATVFRGIAGFGANSRIHTATILRLSEDLPIVVEWIDTTERVDRVLPRVKTMVGEGLITLEDAQIIRYQHRVVEDIVKRLQVREVMTRDVTRVRPDMPLREAVELLVGRNYRAAPVVDAQNHVVGIVTNGDLVERGGLRLRVDMLKGLTPQVLAAALAAVEEGKSVADVMTRDVVTIAPEATLAEAAHLMVTRRLKRLPVVDRSAVLVGMISRLDILQTCSTAYPQPRVEVPSMMGRTIGDVMRTDIPVVERSASLADVLDAVISTRLNRALVLDEARHVLGVVSDAELTRRISPQDHPGLVPVLVNHLQFASLSPEQRRDLEQAFGRTADMLMTPNIPAVTADTPLAEAIATMLRERQKVLPVVDENGRLLGAVDRADLLRILVGSEGKATS